MSILNTIKTNANTQEDTDVVGGGSFSILDSGIYKATIETAYITQSSGGALAINLRCKVKLTSGGSQMHFETIYVTNRKGENFYTKDGKSYPLPGYSTMNALFLNTIGLPIEEAATEQGTVELYSFDAGKTVPTLVECVPDIAGTNLYICMLKVRENKRKEVNGKWLPSPDEKIYNRIDKFLFANGDLIQTQNEIREGKNRQEYATQWKEKWGGVLKDDYKAVAELRQGFNPKPATEVADSIDIV